MATVFDMPAWEIISHKEGDLQGPVPIVYVSMCNGGTYPVNVCMGIAVYTFLRSIANVERDRVDKLNFYLEQLEDGTFMFGVEVASDPEELRECDFYDLWQERTLPNWARKP